MQSQHHRFGRGRRRRLLIASLLALVGAAVAAGVAQSAGTATAIPPTPALTAAEPGRPATAGTRTAVRR